MNYKASVPANYKLYMKYNITALQENNIQISTEEYIVLDWAHDLMCNDEHPSLEEAGTKYIELDAEKCIRELPMLRLDSKRSVQKKLDKLVKQKLLMAAYPKGRTVGTYYGFTTKATKLFPHFGVLDSVAVHEIGEQAEAISQMLVQLDPTQLLLTLGDEFYEKLIGMLADDITGQAKNKKPGRYAQLLLQKSQGNAERQAALPSTRSYSPEDVAEVLEHKFATAKAEQKKAQALA
jgi:hypothetical protein